ncbi:dethiobiotin synthase [Myceligenerans crystallogenes]|uniref:ATP-dependent dethiobiotin synthetase BioD n=1 Tax=Myceligenerans crystallogenes TaxID=316335 RepID=A0ABP4ZM09_9MICO
MRAGGAVRAQDGPPSGPDRGGVRTRGGPAGVLHGVVVVTGTCTGVGKTVVTAALAAAALAAGRSVAVVKPAQTGVSGDEPGDVHEVARLAGDVTVHEHARYPEPLAPATAARRAGLRPVRAGDVAREIRRLARTHDLVLVEGAGGLLVRFDDDGGTLADLATLLGAPVVLVAAAGLGTLNATALTAEALRHRGLTCAGVVIGSMPAEPDLASRCNVADLPVVAGAPLIGVVPERAGALPPETFRARAATWLRDPTVASLR